MKINYKILTVIALTSLFFTSCDDGDAVVDNIVSNTERGAILRTINLVSNELPIGVADGSFIVDLEVQDQEDGGLVDQVEVYIGFRDNTEDFGPGTNVDQVLFETIDKSTFSISDFGLPRFSYSVTLPELLAFVGRTETDITGGDQFEVRFELVLSDGRRFSFANNSGTLTGSFFRSPFLYTPTVICPVTEGLYTGTYLLTQETDGVFGAVFEDGNVEIVATGGTSREIAVNAYPQFGGFARNFPFELICDAVKIPDFDAGLGCGDPNIMYMAAEQGTTYDDEDDSTITIIFTEVGGGCGGVNDITITLTRV